MARDDPPASSTAAVLQAALAAAMRGKVGSEFESKISYNAPMHFRHRQTDWHHGISAKYILHLALKILCSYQ